MELNSIALPLKGENIGPKPRHGPGGNSTYSAKPKCGAKTRAGGGHPCGRVAGHGTNHLGQGKCKYHGGCSTIKHGLHSTVVPVAWRASYQAALEAPDTKSLLEHIALIDGVILPGALARGEKAPKHAGEIDPIDLQLRAIDTKSKVVKRLHDMEDGQKIKFTEAELKLLVMQMVAVVAEFVDGPTMKKIATRLGVRTDNSKPQSVAVCNHDADR